MFLFEGASKRNNYQYKSHILGYSRLEYGVSGQSSSQENGRMGHVFSASTSEAAIIYCKSILQERLKSINKGQALVQEIFGKYKRGFGFFARQGKPRWSEHASYASYI
jgi:hypothetical protein